MLKLASCSAMIHITASAGGRVRQKREEQSGISTYLQSALKERLFLVVFLWWRARPLCAGLSEIWGTRGDNLDCPICSCLFQLLPTCPYDPGICKQWRTSADGHCTSHLHCLEQNLPDRLSGKNKTKIIKPVLLSLGIWSLPEKIKVLFPGSLWEDAPLLYSKERS